MLRRLLSWTLCVAATVVSLAGCSSRKRPQTDLAELERQWTDPRSVMHPPGAPDGSVKIEQPKMDTGANP